MKSFVKIILLVSFPLLIHSQENFDIRELENIQKEIADIDGLVEENEQVLVEDSLKDNVSIRSEYFGYDFFNKKSLTNTPLLDIPLQGEYEISLNDELEILLTGSIDRLYKVRVDFSGNILIPEVGKINLSNLTLRKAEEKISIAFSNSYVGVESSLSVANASVKKISVIGAVKKPGTYLVNPFITIIEAIMYAEGLVDGASLRRINVKSATGEQKTVDLYDYLISGNIDVNKNLKNGDTIIVSTTNNFIDVSGEVFRPKRYEYIQNDSISDLIYYALGLNQRGDYQNISIQHEKGGIVNTSIVGLDFVLKGDKFRSLNIGSNVVSEDLYLEVIGDTVSQGFKKFNKGDYLRHLLDYISITDQTYPFYAALSQTEGIYEEKKYFFSLNDESTYSDLKLSSNPKVYFFSKDEILDNSFDRSLINNNDLIRVDTGLLNLSLPMLGKTSADQIANYLGISYKIQQEVIAQGLANAKLPLSTSFNASDVDYLSFIEDKKDYINVSISGEVKNAGIFTLPSGSTLEDLYDVAGGFRDSAFTKGIIFTRQVLKDNEKKEAVRARQVILDSIMQNTSYTGDFQALVELIKFSEDVEYMGRLTGNFEPGEDTVKKTSLNDGDAVFVPVISNQISIKGEILNPMSVVFEPNLTYGDLINLSGNYTDYADKKAAYVIRADGTSFLIGNNYFERQIYPEPGDILVIPRDYEKITGLPLISTAARVLADIAFAAASLNAVQQN